MNKKDIKNFVRQVFDTSEKKVGEHLILGELTDHEILLIKAKTGFDLKGFCRIIDKSAVKHIIKFHGDKITEENRGQIAVTIKDFEILPKILKPENITGSQKNRIGRDCIVYAAKIGDTYYCVEEIRTGRKHLALNTLYKRK